MPLFNPVRPGALAVSVGETFVLFAATDTLTAGSLSAVFTVADSGPVPRQAIGFTFNFTTAPTAVVELLGSNTMPTASGPQNGVVLYTSTNQPQDKFLDSNSFAFYWALLVSQSAGGALSLIGHVQ